MKTRFFAFAALALALAACDNGNEILNNDGPVAARFTADIMPATRVNSEGNGFTDGDRIGITGIGTVYDNVPYMKKGTFEAEGTVIYFQSTEEVVFRAYYPYNPTGGPFPVTTDADAQENQPAIDFLFASGATGNTYNPEVKFTDETENGGPDHSFHHCMSQITLTFEAGSGVDFDAAKPDRYTLSGLKLDGTFDTASGTAAVGDQAQARELAIPLDGAVRSSVILIPQEANTLSLTVVYNAADYHATLTVPDGALKAGNNYTWTVRVNATGLTLEGSTIGAWGDGQGEEGKAEDGGYIYDETTHTYIVYNANGLLTWGEAARKDLSLNCTLTADITLPKVDEGESNWTPVGYSKNAQYDGYTGTFEGGGHTITGLTINLPDQDFVGLFGVVGKSGTPGKVQNLTLAEVKIKGCDDVGGVVGFNYGTVTDCSVSGNVSGYIMIGGVVGYNDRSTVTGCYATGNVSGTNENIGGVVGLNNFGTMTGCYATGDVSGSAQVGGVAGSNYGTLTGCYATGKVTGSYRFSGGVVGYVSYSGTVTACYATGDVSGDSYVGGVLGAYHGSTVTACYWRNNLDGGVGDNGAVNNGTTKIDGTDVTWQTAQSDMNEAIETWNAKHSDNPCNWRYAETDAETPPTLEPKNN